MRLRLLAFSVTLITIVAIYPLIASLVAPIAKWTLLFVVAWYLSNFVKRKLILKQMGSISSEGKAVLVTGEE